MVSPLALRHTLYQQAITGARGLTRDAMSADVTHIIVGKVGQPNSLTQTDYANSASPPPPLYVACALFPCLASSWRTLTRIALAAGR